MSDQSDGGARRSRRSCAGDSVLTYQLVVARACACTVRGCSRNPY
jgi:hypothetical protein